LTFFDLEIPAMAPQKTVLITGCSDGGIGHGLAVVFQQRGYHVFATTRNPATMSKLKDLPNVTLLKLDVRDKADIKAAVEAVTSQSGGTLDYLVNNAGLGHYMPILDLDLDDAQRLFAINVWGPVAIVQAFAPLLIKSQGTVAFITSVAGYLNVPYLGDDGPSIGCFLKPRSNFVDRHLCCVEALSRDHCRDSPSRT
jgi:NAD(P)-dependent dehydrogenase (short-subunit alcohol dehydrogenase family)